MPLGVPAGELFMLAAAVILGGIITGLLAGLFGVGGGAIVVPVQGCRIRLCCRRFRSGLCPCSASC
jgi:hypothetical protein